MRTISLVLAVLAAASLPACFSDSATPPAEPPIVDSGDYFQFVQTGWVLPTSWRQAEALGMDLDGDGYVDNSLGGLYSALNSIGLEVTLASEEAFVAGDLVLLHSLRADSLIDDESVSWQLFSGSPSEPPRFDGTDALTAVSDQGTLLGEIRGGVMTAEFGGATLLVPLFPGQPALALSLEAAYLEVYLGDTGSAGRIAGSIDALVLREEFLPRLAEQVSVHMATHPDHPFTTSALQLFDANDDGLVSIDEFVSTTRFLFAPDLDLDDDGEDDHLSIALGFAVVPATFAPLSR